MDIEFWNQRWENNQIGFHQQKVNPYLSYFYGTKGMDPARRSALKVFVPLCGKSLDLLWLAQNGYAVLGVECSDRAVDNFFSENGLNYQSVKKHDYAFYRHTGQLADIEIYQGDFFALQPEDFSGISDVFDRAALIALPEDMRRSYVNKMAELQQPGTRTLLVTLTYDQSEMAGPPFSVSEAEVNRLYAKDFQVEKLLYKDALEQEAHFKAKGLTALTETVYKLKRKTST